MVRGEQRRFVDGPRPQLGIMVKGHRPLPAFIPFDIGNEPIIKDILPHITSGEEGADVFLPFRSLQGHTTGELLGVLLTDLLIFFDIRFLSHESCSCT